MSRPWTMNIIMKTEHRRLKSASELKYSERTWNQYSTGLHSLRRWDLYQLKLLHTRKSSSTPSSFSPSSAPTEVFIERWNAYTTWTEQVITWKETRRWIQWGRRAGLEKGLHFEKTCGTEKNTGSDFLAPYEPHLRMDELKSLACRGRKILLSKICCHNLEWTN